jgi:hypothetical protein
MFWSPARDSVQRVFRALRRAKEGERHREELADNGVSADERSPSRGNAGAVRTGIAADSAAISMSGSSRRISSIMDRLRLVGRDAARLGPEEKRGKRGGCGDC